MNTSQKMRNVGKNNFMRKLALSDEILLKISQPARYIGGEVNMVKKDPSKVAVRFAMCFPDVYEIGMSHLGIQILYDMFNRRDDVYCERVYSPWMDLDPIMREQKIPLFAVESQDPIKKFDFLGITIHQYFAGAGIITDSAPCRRSYRGGSDRYRRRSVYLQSGADRTVFRSLLYGRGRGGLF